MLYEKLTSSSSRDDIIQAINAIQEHGICALNVDSSPGVVNVYDGQRQSNASLFKSNWQH